MTEIASTASWFVVKLAGSPQALHVNVLVRHEHASTSSVCNPHSWTAHRAQEEKGHRLPWQGPWAGQRQGLLPAVVQEPQC
jgi:hypothetical protein